MKILVTGARGFIGKNLVCVLKSAGEHHIFEFTSGDSEETLKGYCADCDFVFHLAGVNRPQSVDEFETGNAGLTRKLVSCLAEGSRCPVVFSSSIQAENDTPYGRSKRKAEDVLRTYSEETGAPVYIYRLPNVFGKWCKPDYNSVIATFCCNITHDLPIHVSDEAKLLRLVYIDDVVKEFLRALDGNVTRQGEFCAISEVYVRKLGGVAQMLREFSQCTQNLSIPDQSDTFIKKLYSTYLSYLPASKFSYQLVPHSDARGSFAEFLRTNDRGQLSVNVTRPHAVKGNHWHHTKHEIFLTVSGTGVIRLRRIGESRISEIIVTGNKLEPVLIPPGYTHMLENLGETDLVTIMWANEPFDPERPDTFHLNVQEETTCKN